MCVQVRCEGNHKCNYYIREGWVGWKWDCHPVSELGQECVTSVQCQQVSRVNSKIVEDVKFLNGIAEHFSIVN